MNTMLVPLDGSALAEQVLPYVRVLAPALAARVLLLRVISDAERERLLGYNLAPIYGLVGETLDTTYRQEQQRWELIRQHAEDYLEVRAQELREAGLEVETEVNFGSPARQIIEVAAHENVTLIAMAAHDYNSLQRLAFGSVSDKVAHATHTPFLLVRGEPPPLALAGEHPVSAAL